MTDAARSHRSSFIVHRSVFNVVVHTPDVVGDRMAGPGIRAWHLRRDDGPEPSIAAEMVGLRGPWRPVQAAPDSTGREVMVV